MVKDNHLIALGAASVTGALLDMRKRLPHTVHVEVEMDYPEQIEAVLAAKVDTVLLDNYSTEQMRAAVKQIGAGHWRRPAEGFCWNVCGRLRRPVWT